MTEQNGVGRSATEELRRMLDERGVEWWEGWNKDLTLFDGANGVRWMADYTLGELFLRSVLAITPEQAIAATLGDAGTCHITVQDNLAETEGMGDVWLECDACHWQMPLEPSTPRFNFCPNCRRRVVSE